MTGERGARPGSVMVVVPTTAGPLLLRSLQPRPGLPASAAFAEGDYRPLPWSADYARLCAPDGPLSRLETAPVPHELRLTGSFDAGRSWEVPVCLAHGLVARGWRIVTDPAATDLVLWATGAVDVELAVLAGDYALLDKIERSRALLDAAPQADLAFLLPDGPERAEAEHIIDALGRQHALLLLPAGSAAGALEALSRPGDAEPAASAQPSRLRRLVLPLAATGLAVAVALGALTARPPATGAIDRPTDDPESSRTKSDARTEPALSADASKPPDAPLAVIVEELVAPAGSSCRRVVFGADPLERRRVPVEDGERLRASRLTPDLCGFALRPSRSGLRVEVGPALRAAALPPVRLPDGAHAYFLREGARQNLVYTVQAISEAGEGPPGGRFAHAVVEAEKAPPTRAPF